MHCLKANYSSSVLDDVSLGTHQGSDETSENTDQHTALYWGRADTHTLILNTFGSWSSVCMFW